MYAQPVTISEGARFALISYGNGAAYTLRDKQEGLSAFFQGDDAATLRDELDGREAARPDDLPDSILGFLWFDIEYGRIAEKDD